MVIGVGCMADVGGWDDTHTGSGPQFARPVPTFRRGQKASPRSRGDMKREYVGGGGAKERRRLGIEVPIGIRHLGIPKLSECRFVIRTDNS